MSMMLRTAALTLALMGIFIVSAMTAGRAADKGNFSTEPRMHNEKKWKIGYYEGGEYFDYQKTLTETVRGLMKMGWIETAEIPPQKGEQTKELWHWLATGAKSHYIEFIEDFYYSANWDDTLRPKMTASIIERLNKKKDIDLLIAMGTRAGQDMANDKHSIPTLVITASDPISAGIIKSLDDSGFEHIHAYFDPNRFERQVKVFHEIIGFKKLGVAYEDSVSGKSYAAIDVIEKVAKERNFEVVKCFTISDVADIRSAETSLAACFDQLVLSADAIYVTQQGGLNQHSIPELAQIANKHRIPTFSQSGSEEVKLGFLVSLSQAGFKYEGEFNAQSIAKIFNGAKPYQLDQLFEQPPKIAINLKTAESIGFDPPIVLLGAADEIFRE
ncbi:MAG: ABC transporter substrate binding protein [Gammaproteobacteria bacterium]